MHVVVIMLCMNASAAKTTTHKRNKVCTAIGKSLKAMRISRDVSQETLAFNAQIDRTYISQIERGVANPSVLALGTICYALGITLAELFESVNVSLKPGDPTRRSNAAQPDNPPVKSRLR